MFPKKVLFDIPPEERQKIAIIGGGAMGMTTASILSQLGIGEVTLLEAESTPLSDRSASLNNTGILHHFVYGGHYATLDLLFKQTCLFKKVMPDHIFADSYVNYLAPNFPENTAIYQKGVTLEDVSKNLTNIYIKYLNDRPGDRFFGEPESLVQDIDIEQILFETGDKNSFNRGVRVKQPVLNLERYRHHLIFLINRLIQEKLVILKVNHLVTNIRINEVGFELEINGEYPQIFNTVINAGYAGGLEIPISSFPPPEKGEGNIVKLKAYGLYRIPEALKVKIPQLTENLSSTLLIRGQYGGIIKADKDILAIFYGLEYNQAELYVPLSQTRINLPEDWVSWVRSETDGFGDRNEASILQSIQQGVSQWIPWVADLEPIELKKSCQVYPGRQPKNQLEAAKRDGNPIRYCHQHQAGGQYIHIPGSKLTSIVYHAFQVIHRLLETYVEKQILTKQQVDKHLRIDKNKTVIISPELEYSLGKRLAKLPN